MLAYLAQDLGWVACSMEAGAHLSLWLRAISFDGADLLQDEFVYE